jgi:hypothetical protein
VTSPGSADVEELEELSAPIKKWAKRFLKGVAVVGFFGVAFIAHGESKDAFLDPDNLGGCVNSSVSSTVWCPEDQP